jgi:3-oxoadipate enol-lactonase
MPKAQVNGIGMYYQVYGEGEPLVMIQGDGGSHNGWFFQTRTFRRHFQVVVFDNRGIGRTDKSAGPYTIETMAVDTLGLMDHLGIERAHILGVSLGGIVAQDIAIHHPERVKKLVLACTTTGEAEDADVHPEMLRVLGVAEGSTEVDFESVDFTNTMNAVISLAFNRRFYRMFLAPLSAFYLKQAGVEGHRQQMEAVVGYSTAAELHRVQAPTMVITGTGDRIVSPRSSEVIASRLPGARLVKIEGGSHAFNIEMRGRFNKEVLDFLRGS